MEPVILVGDSIEVKPIKDDLKRFDIIVYWNENRKILICHYFWSKNQESYLNDQEPRIITRPLKSKREDFPIMQSRILGKVVNKKIPFSLKLRIIAHTLWQKK